MDKKPLAGLLVLEFSQFMAGPTAGLRLADLGARVVKIERPEKGEGGRQIAIKNIFVDESSLVFHTINRNKESYAADLKNEADLEDIKALIQKADVITHNFRPGVMEKIGLDYESVKSLNPKIIYATVTGYGNDGPWAKKPGQDLLVQSLSGLSWLSGSEGDGPVPFGLAVVDMYCATHLTQGILAALLKRSRTQQSVLVEVSLLESVLDMQFEVLTTHFNDGRKLPQRSAVRGGAHAYLSAPYGVYKTADGYLALAMGNVEKIAGAIGLPSERYRDASAWFSKRDQILQEFNDVLLQKTTDEWTGILEAVGIWCGPVNDYHRFFQEEGFLHAGMTQEVALQDGTKLKTTRSVYYIDGAPLYADKPAPKVGQDNEKIVNDYLVD
ncbi:CaiB/BaiF CoA transferase family protein [Sphingobacterium gobiense]|uniref:Carnitine dehydratase n=1 Tax=Sphingobacterium gobiense TaxID=1382456 RepID=A0A2S9JM40_9SPHI|nr:CaiB/BaiF CoA-transferase family protein [Sphingobacterium gobiense]PRD54191.1 carnitine dehydratase [Sphingobacterium gobiense]